MFILSGKLLYHIDQYKSFLIHLVLFSVWLLNYKSRRLDIAFWLGQARGIWSIHLYYPGGAGEVMLARNKCVVHMEKLLLH
jgi:hypothetical protein